MKNAKRIIYMILAVFVAVFCFNVAIVLDGSLTSYIFRLGTYIVDPLIFNEPIISMLVSLLSAALAHSIVAILIVLPVLYFSNSNHSLLIVSYFLAIVGYVVYELSGYPRIAGSLYIFALVRIVFQTVWLLLWYLTNKCKTLRLEREKAESGNIATVGDF